MNPIDRRALTRAILLGAAAAGLAAIPGAAPAMPLGESVPDALDGLIEKTQWGAPPPRRPPPPRHRHRPRRRVHRCWWHRGRRVCGWRWV